MPLRNRKTEGQQSSRPITRKSRPATSRNRTGAAAVPPANASSASISLSESESDIERVSQKANALLGCFLSFKNHNDDASTESISRDSSVIPTKRPAEPNETSTASERSKKRDDHSSRIKDRAQTQSESPTSQIASSSLYPVVEIPGRIPQPIELPADRHISNTSTRLKRRNTKRIAREESPFSDYIEAPIPPASRSSRRRKGALKYYGRTPRGCSPQNQNEENYLVSKPLSPPPSSSLSSVSEPLNGSGRVCYRSATHIVVREPLVDIAPEYAPYCSLEERKDLESLLKTKKHTNTSCEGTLLHADLCMNELNVLYRFMRSEEKTRNEGCIQVLITEYTRQLFGCGKIEGLLERLATLHEVKLVLSRYTVDIQEFLLGCRNCEMAQQIKSVKHLITICRFLKEKFLVSALVVKNDINTHLKALLQKVDEQKLRAVAQEIKILGRRASHAFRAFLIDAKNGWLSTSPSTLRAYPSKPYEHLQPYDTANVLSHIRARELGYRVYRGKSSIYQTLAKSANENWEHWKSWKGASQDVVVLEWSPDGTRFVAGSATSCSPGNMMYNRRNNLVVGDLAINSLKELPDHRMPRALFDPTRADEGESGNDSQLYTSISAVAWSNDGTRMFSSSYDRTVKVWDTSSHENTKCITTLRHPGKVLVMALSKVDNSRLATGSDRENSFLLWHVEQEYGLALSSSLEIHLRHKKLMTPTSLAWGVNSYTKDLLAAGMSLPDNTDMHGVPPVGGHLTLWRMEEAGVTQVNVMPNSQNVFDISWHPTSRLFAAGIAACGRSKGLGSDIRSMVNVYDPLRGKRDIVSYDCPGIDINDVTFCPFNENYISAGCTDGTTYVWDWRNPDKILHKLKHGLPIREQDVGVQLALWGDQPNRFYTGSSDGCVKLWNIMAATEDVFVRDIVNLGTDITSGSLSSDKTTMLIGDTGGSIHILSTSSPQNEDKSMRFEHAGDELAGNLDSAASAANALIESGQIVRHEKFGPGKGPNYSGPYAAWARPPDTPADQLATTPLTMQVRMQQLYGSVAMRRKYLDDTTYNHVRTQIQLAKYRNKKTYCAVPGSSSNITTEESSS
ncbi:WD repeat protein [Trichophyton benhamiae CBS 112371]|uniref:WD repeat protein n=1 Tax=Arthroderma benhamiae (strain ATCC MYA-4681 / CBS 112371) TaxID=663331 RepID=D4AM30_ARTBC|nr:WD repeat protein [Trichophyton benhamiae CBS 112371]EFE35786.1 WD repeat protein [Trichophyton benhamiae CBS 112371]